MPLDSGRRHERANKRPGCDKLKCMKPLKMKATIDEPTAQALPRLRPFLGKRVELTVVEDTATRNEHRKRLTFEDLLSKRVDAPAGAAPLTDADIEQAILQGALRENA
jgi:hypothetical protein